MTSHLFLTLVGFLAALPAAFAQGSATEPTATPLKLFQTREPEFPVQLARAGLSRGTARLVLRVDAQGRLVDLLPVAYTHRAFADSALRAIRQWRFEPARQGGGPRATNVEVVVTFESHGAIVTQNVQEHLESRLLEIESPRFQYRPCAPRDLDRLLVPRQQTSPRFPKLAGEPGISRRVVVHFYIDEAGRVRAPELAAPAPSLWAEAALEAVSHWQYEPPTRRGCPVLVRALQVFTFDAAPGTELPDP